METWFQSSILCYNYQIKKKQKKQTSKRVAVLEDFNPNNNVAMGLWLVFLK